MVYTTFAVLGLITELSYQILYVLRLKSLVWSLWLLSV